MSGVRATKAYYAVNDPEYVSTPAQGRQLWIPPRERWTKGSLIGFIEQRGFLKHGLKDAWGHHLATCREIEGDFMAAGNFVENTLSDFIKMGCVGKIRPKNAARYRKETDYVISASFLRDLLPAQ